MRRCSSVAQRQQSWTSGFEREATHDASCSVLALVTVDEERVVSNIKNSLQSSVNDLLVDVNEGLFVARDTVLQELDAVPVQEGTVPVSVLLLAHEDDALQFQLFKEGEILLGWVPGSIHALEHHSEIFGGVKLIRLVLSGLRSTGSALVKGRL
eukprot:CAMPEP_0175925580 /NCGR_PEP_ID=MMETSP0108-20121206/15723_1 /TAXON_ID=195067 ORGANISM="Goniomonas pacifica, Strain CCMP1869" /NCGR_SAMPLE_ID=MMETSP0108 /ASSEMBLY_ACC=CAM_ASM_000204 /LENGTH=153 /DNA_ID=CAMNT_0017248743 /DNA_START=320 /DNA_END=778 /DNA_ORIENTATION=-